MIRGVLISVRVPGGILKVQIPDEMGGMREPRESGVLDVKVGGRGDARGAGPTPEDVFDSIFEGYEAWGFWHASFSEDDFGLESEDRSR